VEFVSIPTVFQTKTSDTLDRFPLTQPLVKESDETSLNVAGCV